MQTHGASSRPQYENYQRLFDYMNSNAKMNVHARFATLGEFFADLQQTATAPTPANALPVVQGSFFTYSDREDEFWSGERRHHLRFTVFHSSICCFVVHCSVVVV